MSHANHVLDEKVDEQAKGSALEPPRQGVSDFLRHRKDAIVHAWESRVSSEQRVVELSGLALRDDIPELLDELAEWLAGEAPAETSLVSTKALAHVLQRLDVGLALAQVFREYRLLRETLIEEVLVSEAVEQVRIGTTGDAARAGRIAELARLNAGLDVVLSHSIEHFVCERDRRAAAERALAARERERVEQDVLKKRRELAEAQRLARVGSWHWEVGTDDVACSDELLNIFGLALSPPPFSAQRGTLYPSDSWERLNAAVQEAMRTGSSYELDLEALRSSGEGIWITARGEVTRDASGAIVGMRGTVQDVTERKEIEAALQDANSSLVDSDRRKNHFLAVLAHELRNPLAPIKNSLYILDRAVPGGDQARRAKNVIERQIDQLSHLVDDLLDVTRIARGKIQLQRHRLELNELVRRTLDDHRAVFQNAGVGIEVQFATRPVFVEADWNRTAQVLSNLLQNSAKFTPRGGRVMVTVERDEQARMAVIRVADTGLGMKPEMVARLFEPFTQADETLDRSKGGLGLGLALSKGLVEQHGGCITASSQGLNLGSEFVVRLPLELGAPATDGRIAAPIMGAAHRVLVIEDNVDAAQSLREVLELLGHEVCVAHEGQEGFAKAREFRPDLVLCDIGLPGLDGYEIARAFRADDALRGIRLIALSGYARPEDLRRAAEAGFERYLTKPPSVENLASVIGQVSPI